MVYFSGTSLSIADTGGSSRVGNHMYLSSNILNFLQHILTFKVHKNKYFLIASLLSLFSNN
jgi:hypothetical protein